MKIGYEIGNGEEVGIKPSHLVVTGMTQESGKTTTLMALIKRGKFKAIIFKTKIGEKGITEGSIVPPYYKDEFDWEYASDLLEASRKEKLKFERAWIIKYSKNATNLLEFKRNIDNAMLTLREGLEKNILITLQAYLDKILPELQYAPLSNTIDIREGINIMDLERFKEETQSLIIRSVLREVLRKEKNTIIVIPEAWKYIPEGRGNPVKRDAEAFIRQGATNNNYLWIDSQDITGVDKTILKQVSTWILGYQREINEIKRTIEQLPIPSKDRPTTDDIATLKVGHFYVATSEFTKKVYVQPLWLDSKIAKKIALGKIDVNTINPPESLSPFAIMRQELKQDVQAVTIDLNPIRKEINELRNDFFNKIQQQQDAINKVYNELYGIKTQDNKVDEDLIVGKVLQKITIPTQSNIQFNEEELIKRVLERVPVGMATTYTVAPLEKLQKDFLEEAKQRILDEINKLSGDLKKSLKFAETRGQTSKKEIYNIGLGNKGGYAGGGTFDKGINEMVKNGLMRKDTHGNFFGNLKQRIIQECSAMKITEQEVEQIYNHILMEMLE
jgi:hypothetical protein